MQYEVCTNNNKSVCNVLTQNCLRFYIIELITAPYITWYEFSANIEFVILQLIASAINYKTFQRQSEEFEGF